MDIAALITGLGFGFAGSLHCVGMCGPLALSLPYNRQSGPGKLPGILLYNAGRISSYAVLGGVTGLIGSQLSTFGMQQVFSITLGSFLLLYYALSLRRRRLTNNNSFLFRKLQQVIISNMESPTAPGMLMTGAANGLLPCGTVYLAIAAATATGTFGGAMMFMLAFGLGTVPLMAGISLTGLFVRPVFKLAARKITPYVALAMAALLIIRGLNLDIAFLSPHLITIGKTAIISCH